MRLISTCTVVMALIIFSGVSLADDSTGICIDRFHETRNACMIDFNGPDFAACMKEAVANKKDCLQGDNESEVQITLAPAEVKVLSFAELGVADGAVIIQAPEGDLDTGVLEAAVSRERLVIASPEDIGADQSFKVRLGSGTGDVLISIDVISERSLEVLAVDESDEDGNTAPPASPLLFSGLGEGNAIGGGPLTFSVDAIPALSVLESRFFASTSNGQMFDATPLFVFDKVSNSFTASQASISNFAASLPLGELEFSVSLVSEDFAFTQNYSFRFLRTNVTVIGQLVDASNLPVSGANIDDLNVAVVGFRSGIRRVVSVDASGRFIIPDLIIDTYNFSVIDLEQPNVFTGILGISRGTTNAQVTIFYRKAYNGDTHILRGNASFSRPFPTWARHAPNWGRPRLRSRRVLLSGPGDHCRSGVASGRRR